MKLNSPTTEEVLGAQELDDLSSFFDLLARFDHEDKLKEKSVIRTDSLDSTFRESVPVTENKSDKNPAVRASGKNLLF